MTYSAVRLALKPVLRLLWRVEVSGLERLPDGGCVVVANHESVLDPLLLGVALPRRVRFVAKAELWRSRWLGPWLRSLGAIPVVRGTGDREALRAATEALQAGELVGIFPEGTVLRGGHGVWKRGAARLAVACGAPIVPVAIVDSARAFRPVLRRLGFPIVHIVVGEPIAVEPTEATPRSLAELTAQARSAVARLGEMPLGAGEG
ncbi:MAG: lysophospholipid acyltransferase family protein [Gaiellales bacterium]